MLMFFRFLFQDTQYGMLVMLQNVLQHFQVVLVVIARTAELVGCLLAVGLRRRRLLGRDQLVVRTKGVDKALIGSQKGKELKAFVDGSVIASGACGFAVYYSDGHPLNCSGRIDTKGERTESGLPELAALFWTLMHHPRGQHLSIFSDSMHALNVVAVLSDDESLQPRKAGRGGTAGRRCPTLDARELRLARVVWWLLRLRYAQTCFYKVPAHQGLAQNAVADALAQRAAADEAAPCIDVPLHVSLLGTAVLLLRYMLSQSPMDGGVVDLGLSTADSLAADGRTTTRGRHAGLVRRPQPLSESTDITHVLALDCEMVGVGAFGADSRLASVCVINEAGNQVYFSYAKPTKPVTDYRTWVSGIEPAHLRDAPSFNTVQKEVKHLLAGHVIVGHSLEHDFGALGFSPPRHMCRDTAHDVRRLLSRGGRPRKLRHITWEFLGLVIQDSADGHSPLEDAQAALFLYLRFRDEFEARAKCKLEEYEAKQKVAAQREKKAS